MAAWRTEHGQRIAEWLAEQTRHRSLERSRSPRQLIWVAKALLDGPEEARAELLELFGMQANVLMLGFAGACAFFAMAPHPADGVGWQALPLLLGCVSMCIPLHGAVTEQHLRPPF